MRRDRESRFQASHVFTPGMVRLRQSSCHTNCSSTAVISPVHTGDYTGDYSRRIQRPSGNNFLPNLATVSKNGDCRRIRPQSPQSPVWTGLCKLIVIYWLLPNVRILQSHIVICCDVTFQTIIAKFTEKVKVELSKIDM